METKKVIEKLLAPSSIAIVGASRKPGKIGFEILKNIKEYGYKGKIYPINPHANEILGIKAYPSILSVKNHVDLAIIAVPAALVINIVKECVEARVNAIAVITSGFGEVGNRDLELEIVKTARKGCIRVLGPNIFGIYYSGSSLNATFGPRMVKKGRIAFITQSGALGIAFMGWAVTKRIGMSAIISMGNKADLDDSDFFDFFRDDPEALVVIDYLEGVKDGRPFIRSAKSLTVEKPLIIIKSGSSKRGRLAASSHTGSLAGSDEVYNAVFRQCGVMRAETVTQAFNWAKGFLPQYKYTGDRTLIITNGGGVGVLATDACEKQNVTLLDPSNSLKERLRSYMPEFGSLRNPIDLTGMAGVEDYEGAIQEALEHSEVDNLIVLYCETAVTDPISLAKKVIALAKTYRKPLFTSFIGGDRSNMAIELLNENLVPAYVEPAEAVEALSKFIFWNKWRLSRERNAETG